MTQEQKELLLKDLCSRLSYGVKAKFGDSKPLKITKIEQFHSSKSWFIESDFGIGTILCPLHDIKPYLFPLSSMSKEQQLECSFAIHLDMSWLDINLETDQFTMITYHAMDFF